MNITIPQLAEGVESGTVVKILVTEGQTIAKDQPVLEMETQKAIGIVPSPVAGTVTKLLVKEGQEVAVGQAIISVAEGAASGASPARPAVARQPKSEREPTKKEASPSAQEYHYASSSGAPPPAAPSLRRAAKAFGIDLAKVRGSGRGGRILPEDIRAHVQHLQQGAARGAGAPSSVKPAPHAESIDFSHWGPVTTQPLTPLRKAISRQMSESWTTIPHVTQFDEADITALLELRKTHAPAYEKQGARLTLTIFALKAVVAVLKKHPMFNVSLDEAAGQIVSKAYWHIGVAVDTDAGLIVPVIRDVDKKTLLELAKEVEAVAEKTRQRRIALEELRGGTFTITNQGGIGSGPFTPIINKPEVAILGLGRGALKPVIRNGKVEARTILPLSLSYDHRAVDGANAARFMVDLVQALEQFPEADIRLAK